MGDIYNDMREARRERRDSLGVESPECKRLRPRENASALLTRLLDGVEHKGFPGGEHAG